MRKCPKCKAEFSDDKKYCNNCRVQLLPFLKPESSNQEVKENQSNSLHYIIIQNKYVIVTFLIIVVIVMVIISRENKSSNVLESVKTETESYPHNVRTENDSFASVKECLLEWHNSLGSFDYKNHIKYYAPNVRYFNKVVDLNYIIKEKTLFFNSGEWRNISNDISSIRAESLSENKVKTYFNYDCEFVKNTGRVYSVNVDKMIVWDKVDGKWKITEEKDIRLIKNRSHK